MVTKTIPADKFFVIVLPHFQHGAKSRKADSIKQLIYVGGERTINGKGNFSQDNNYDRFRGAQAADIQANKGGPRSLVRAEGSN